MCADVLRPQVLRGFPQILQSFPQGCGKTKYIYFDIKTI